MKKVCQNDAMKISVASKKWQNFAQTFQQDCWNNPCSPMDRMGNGCRKKTWREDTIWQPTFRFHTREGIS